MERLTDKEQAFIDRTMNERPWGRVQTAVLPAVFVIAAAVLVLDTALRIGRGEANVNESCGELLIVCFVGALIASQLQVERARSVIRKLCQSPDEPEHPG